jgi:hypothetical protein
MRRFVLTAMTVMLSLLTGLSTASAAVDFDALSTLPPGERYRQLSLVLLLAGETDPALIHTENRCRVASKR